MNPYVMATTPPGTPPPDDGKPNDRSAVDSKSIAGSSISGDAVRGKYETYIPQVKGLVYIDNKTLHGLVYDRDFSTAFAKFLFERPEVHPWAVFALHGLPINEVGEKVRPLLWKYSNGLRIAVTKSFVSALRRNCHRIARNFGILCGVQDPFSNEDPKDRPLLITSQDIQALFDTGRPFQQLVREMRKIFYFDDSANLQEIVALVLDQFLIDQKQKQVPYLDDIKIYSGAIKLHWNLKSFLRGEFEGQVEVDLGSVITLTGSACYAEAMTCEKYLEMHWPSTSSVILDLLRVALVNGKANFTSKSGPKVDLELVMEGNDLVEILINARIKTIIDVLQQLAWLGAALRTSRSDRIEYAIPVVTAQGDEMPIFDVGFNFKPLHEQEAFCWHPLFSNPVIVSGFPISRRGGMHVGLEIPLKMMAALGGVRHPVEYEGGILLKGFSSMFVLMQMNLAENTIQWHFIQNEDEDERLLYADVDTRCPGRALIDVVGHASLNSARAILGWWGRTSTHLGTEDTTYENLDWTSTQQVDRSIAFSGASLGFQTFGAGQLNFTVGAKDGKLHLSRKGWYQRIVRCAASMPTILYDPGERRAWLVPTSAVILHIAHTRHYRKFYDTTGNRLPLTFADPDLESYDAAAKALLQNVASKLSNGDGPRDPDYLFRDFVFDQWSVLENLVERQIAKETEPEKEIRLEVKPRLRGWEFMDLVCDNAPLVLREASLLPSAGDWLSLARDINAIVLFGSGFGDIIRPLASSTAGLCHKWRTVPKDKDYLAATVSTMNRLFEKAGSKHTQEHLAPSHIRWHRGSKLFDSCADKANFQCSCDRVQEIVCKSFARFRNIIPPGPLEDKGAVIFGKPATFWRLNKPDDLQTRRKELYSQPNLPLLIGTDSPGLAVPGSPTGDTTPCASPLDSSTTIAASDGELMREPYPSPLANSGLKDDLISPMKRPLEEEEEYFSSSSSPHRRLHYDGNLHRREKRIARCHNHTSKFPTVEREHGDTYPSRASSVLTTPIKPAVRLRRKTNFAHLSEPAHPQPT